MGVFAAGGIITEHSELGVAWHVPTLSGKDSSRTIAGFLKEALDSGSAVFVTVDGNDEKKRHAICIAGYDIREGRMALQCLDSNRGEYAKTIDRLMAEVEEKDLAPFAVLGWPQTMPVQRSLPWIRI
jgi:hypothetical protein